MRQPSPNEQAFALGVKHFREEVELFGLEGHALQVQVALNNGQFDKAHLEDAYRRGRQAACDALLNPQSFYHQYKTVAGEMLHAMGQV